jgi:hypothetical protein
MPKCGPRVFTSAGSVAVLVELPAVYIGAAPASWPSSVLKSSGRRREASSSTDRQNDASVVLDSRHAARLNRHDRAARRAPVFISGDQNRSAEGGWAVDKWCGTL